jgi:hypothetical protein
MKNIYRLLPIVLLVLLFTAYGCQKDKVPAVTTGEITGITGNSATGSGTVTDEGSGPVTSRGICWSTYYLPTIADEKVEEGDGAGDFTGDITGLDGGTTYYARAYATNSIGTGYGASSAFTTAGLTQLEALKIQNYITNNPGLLFQLKPSGLYYYEVVTGTGPSLVSHDIAYIKFRATLFDGTELDTNIGKADTLVFPVNDGWVISGLNEGISYMNEGGKAKLIIPSTLAYGQDGFYPLIPGNTPILFEVDLVRVVKR